MTQPDYDLCVIGGGINGVGIAREAAGRGLSVLLVEAQDLAQGTSSASTKLIHGGLRYLEMGEFRLVRESLRERATLMRIAPHLVYPLDFVMPWVPALRPRWMIGLGLWLYDHLAGRSGLEKSSAFKVRDSLMATQLQNGYDDAFKYADCWADDARLVVLNAMDAKMRGAEILTRTACIGLAQAQDQTRWLVKLRDLRLGGDEFQISARMVVNAAGPWVRALLETSGLNTEKTPGVRLVKGSHMVVPRLFEGSHAFLLQQPDRRVVFAIPYEHNFTLIGTTDEAFEGDAFKPAISEAEKEYLCEAVNRFFITQISPSDARWTFSGIRALYDDGQGESRKITRDYKFDLNRTGAPILSVFGGKLTTYRALAKHAVDRLTGKASASDWSAREILPGGDFDGGDFDQFLSACIAQYDFLPRDVLHRYARAYGTRLHILLRGADSIRDLGRDFGGGLYEVEVRYLVANEFACTAEDILWRRTKLGLHLEKKSILALEVAMPDYLKDRQAAS